MRASRLQEAIDVVAVLVDWREWVYARTGS
jgi:hypothetical protein